MAAVTSTIKYLAYTENEITIEEDVTLYLAHPNSSLPSTTGGVRIIEGTWTVASGDPPWQNYKDRIANVVIIPGPNNEPISPVYVNNLFREMYEVQHLDLSYLDISNSTSLHSMFYQCIHLKSLDMDTWDTSNILNFNWMFAECESLTLLDLSNFDVSSAVSFECMFYNSPSITYINLSTWVPSSSLTAMRAMFKYCTALTSIDVTWTGCDLSNVTKFDAIFQGCENLLALNLVNWNITSAESFEQVFDGCYKLKTLNVAHWNFALPDSFYCMFFNCKALQSVSLPTTTPISCSALTMAYMFSGCESLQSVDISKFMLSVSSMTALFSDCYALQTVRLPLNVGLQLTSIRGIFNNCYALESVTFPNNFNTTNITTLEDTFYNCYALESVTFGPTFNTSNVTNMAEMFSYCESLASLDLSMFNTSNVTSMYGLFQGCTSLRTVDLSSFNTSKVTDMRWMFTLCPLLGSLSVNHFDVSKVTRASFMFNQCQSLTSLNLSNWVTSALVSARGMFSNCKALTTLNISNFTTANVTDFCAMFQACQSLTSLNLSHFNTSKATDMSYMFNGCLALTQLDISTFNTSLVTNMLAMFQNCNSLLTLNLSHFNTGNVTDMSFMFNRCLAMTQLNVSSFDTSKVSTMSSMFQTCTAMTSVSLSNFDTSNTIDMSFMFAGTKTAMPNIDMTVLDTSSATNISNMFADATITNIDLSNFDTSNVTNIQGLFLKSSGVPLDLNIDALDTSSVTDFSNMFSNSDFVTLDLSTFDTSNAINMQSMFSNCADLEAVDVSSFDTTQAENLRWMFNECRNLQTVDISNFDFNNSDVSNFFDMQNNDGEQPHNILSGILEINGTPSTYSNMFRGTYGDIILKGSCTNLQQLANTANHHNVWVYSLSANVSGGRDDYATSSIILEVDIQRFRALNESVNVQMYLDTDAAPLTSVEWYDSEDAQREHPLSHLIMDDPVKTFIAVIPYIDENTSHVLHIYTNDAFGEATARRISIPTVYYTIDFLRGGKEISFGAKAEANDLFSILDTPAAPPFTYEYYLSEDTTVNPAKIYYRYTAGDYEVVEPIGTEDPTIEGWYELQTEEFFQEYIRKNILTYIRLESKPADWSTAWNTYYTRKHESLFKVAMTTDFEDKATATLEDILRDSAISPVADYVVEQGVSGIWIYRKWNSGLAECWGQYTYSATASTVWAAPIYVTDAAGPQQYPFVFASVPMEWASVDSSTNALWLYKESNAHNTASQTATYHPLKVNAFNSNTIDIRYYVTGRWK